MVKRGTELPKKLKNDAIVEALLELRFESKGTPEVFFGRFIDHQNWRDWTERKLPAYNLPAQIRSFDPNFQFAPVIELVDEQNKTILRIGPSVVSYHRQAPYVGWEKFKPELDKFAATLFETAKDAVVRRIGLRYLNALQPNVHGIRGLTNLDLAITVSGDSVSDEANLNFAMQLERDSTCIVRIATPQFLQGPKPEGTSVFVDVDVFTKEGFQTRDKNAVNAWVEFAHTQEKAHFFGLFKQETIDRLREN